MWKQFKNKYTLTCENDQIPLDYDLMQRINIMNASENNYHYLNLRFEKLILTKSEEDARDRRWKEAKRLSINSYRTAVLLNLWKKNRTLADVCRNLQRVNLSDVDNNLSVRRKAAIPESFTDFQYHLEKLNVLGLSHGNLSDLSLLSDSLPSMISTPEELLEWRHSMSAAHGRFRWYIAFHKIRAKDRIYSLRRNDILRSFDESQSWCADEKKSVGTLYNMPLSFDVSFFQHITERALSNGVKCLLIFPTEHRTLKQVLTIMNGIKKSGLKTFGDYPLYMQHRLAKVAWYDVVTPGRVIIRQGQVAENFYFILSGRARATHMVCDFKTGRDKTYFISTLRKGKSFGEYSLLGSTAHMVTVTTETTVELLVINRYAYNELAYDCPTGEIPEHIRYLSNIPFMKNWPLELLLDQPENCIVHYFRKNSVILKNSRYATWIYIVRSGSCKVLKEMKQIKTKLCDSHNTRLPWTNYPRYKAKTDSGFKRKKDWWHRDKKLKIDDNVTLINAMVQNVDMICSEFPNLTTVLNRDVSGKLKLNDRKTVYVQLEMLKEKDVFGLASIQFDKYFEEPMANVTLVSRGADILMLNKQFFVDNINEKSKWDVRNFVSQYPPEEQLYRTLQGKVNWERYKSSVVSDAVPGPPLLACRFDHGLVFRSHDLVAMATGRELQTAEYGVELDD